MRTYEDWIPIIKEFENSSMTISAFCRSKDISYDAFYWHYRKKHHNHRSHSVPEVDIEIIPVTVVENNLESSVVHLNGVEVAADISTLQKLLGIHI